MKEIKIDILASEIMEITKEPLTVAVEDDAEIVQAIAAADQIFARLSHGKFPIKNITSLLQLVWNPREWNFYEDMGIEIRDLAGNWIPLRGNPLLNLPPGTSVKLTPDAGC